MRHPRLLPIALSLLMVGCAQAPPGPVGETASSAKAERRILQTQTLFNRAYHSRSGCYTAGDQQFRFKFYTDLTKDPNQWRQIAQAVTRACTDTIVLSRPGEYYATPWDFNKPMMVMWKNITNGQYGYLTFTTSGIGHYILTNTGRSIDYFDSPSVSWDSGGQTVTLSFRRLDTSTSTLERGSNVYFSLHVTGTR